MAEEDLIFGKNRHLFGGIEPANMQVFEAYDRSGGIRLYLTLPKHTIIDNQILCTVGGVVIRKSTSSYPKNEFDGTEFANVVFDGATYSHELFDEDVVANRTYYYSAFPYTTQGVYNRNAAMSGSKNRCSRKKTAITYGYLYGFDIDTKDENPETRVSYPSDVDNYSWGSVKANTSGANYGLSFTTNDKWLSHLQPGVDFTPKPCMLNYNGTVAEYLDPYDYTKNVNGVASSLNTSGNNTSNAMMEWPKIYVKRTESNGVYKFRCSDTKIDSSYDCYCNYDKNNNIIDHFYTAIYPLTSNVNASTRAQSSTQKYRSLCNCQYLKLNETLETVIARARENGDDWDIEQLCDRLLINDLLILITKSTNIQSKLGHGMCTQVYDSMTTATDSFMQAVSTSNIHKKGLFYGKTGTSATEEFIKIFGMVNWYGGLSKVVAGFMMHANKSSTDGNDYVIYRYEKKRSDSNYKAAYGSYKYTLTNSSINYGTHDYIKTMKTLDIGRLPWTGGGSSTTYENGYIDMDQINGLWQIPFWGGGHINSEVGPFSIHMDRVSDNAISGNYNAAYLSCKPSKTT